MSHSPRAHLVRAYGLQRENTEQKEARWHGGIEEELRDSQSPPTEKRKSFVLFCPLRVLRALCVRHLPPKKIIPKGNILLV